MQHLTVGGTASHHCYVKTILLNHKTTNFELLSIGNSMLLLQVVVVVFFPKHF
jgi:hypothetical protein